MTLIWIYCFVLWFPPAIGECPTFYNVPCTVPHYNPGRDTRIFETPEERNVFLGVWDMLESTIKRSCKTTGLTFPQLVMIWLKHQVEPGYCSITQICNNSACIELDSPSNLFTEEIFIPAEHLDVVLSHPETLKLNITRTKIFERQANNSQTKNSCDLQNNAPPQQWDFPFYNFSSNLNKWNNASKQYFHEYCQDHRINDFTFYIDGMLDFFCSRLVICSYKKCIVYSMTAQKYAKVFPVGSCFTNRYPDLPICSAIEINSWFIGRRKKRRPLISLGRMFQLPFHKYCGPGTNIIVEDDSGGPNGPVDEACRQHDIAYMLGEDPIKADDELLRSVRATGSPYFYLFWVAMKAKQAFEAVTGKAYTSQLYVAPAGTAATFAHHFYFNSVFDGDEYEDGDSLQLDIIRDKETLWRDAVLDIWRGQCFVQKRPGSETENRSDKSLDINPSTSQTITSDTRNKGAEENIDDDVTVLVESDYPPPPEIMAPCRVVINEILTNDGVDSNSFIELLKICPEKGDRNRANSLRHFYLAVIQGGDPPKLHVFINLSKQVMVGVEDTTATSGGLQKKNNYYFVIGSRNIKEKNINLKLAFGGLNGVPPGTSRGETYSVVLLESKSESMKRFSDKCRGKLPLPMTVPDIESFGIALQDIVTYGEPCKLVKCSTFIKWNLGLLQLEDDATVVPIPDQTDTKVRKSINRCSKNACPMQQESWELANPSPFKKNQCSVKVDPLYIFKRGSSIQSSAQYVIMNVRNFFHAHAQGNVVGLLEGTETELTSKATGISVTTVNRINMRHHAGNIQTPRGRKRKRVSRAICRFTEADKNHIKEYIQDQFKKNLPSFLEGIYNDAKEHFRKQNRPMCGVNTLRKLLYMMGFHYGRINSLIVVLERPDIVVKRGIYLKKMRENDERKPTPKPVIYTDESWIDPNARSGKAWVPRSSECDHEEQVKYSYQKHNANRGRRIILIHAAGPNGLIINSEKVFEVGGSKGMDEQDYHDNIESTFYFAWFRDLCVNVKAEYGDSIIVIDNAPYHTKSDAPKSSARKKDLDDYLKKIDNDGKLTGYDNKRNYLRWELWHLVMQYKKENADHYIIDRLAMEYGHTVIRLPPHQCNFNPIEMLWAQGKQKVRKKNPDQKIETVKAEIIKFFTFFTKDDWQKLVAHTDKLREQYWITDKLYDEFLDKHDQQITEEPQEPGAENVGGNGGSNVDEDGPLDCYMHAGNDIGFDDNGDIVLNPDDIDENTED